MSETRRFYWLKLQEDFFDDDTIDFIESQQNGEKYCLFYLKLCLKALKSEGKLIRYIGNMLMPYDEASLAKLTRTDVDTVRSAIVLFSKIGLVERLDSGELYLTQLNEMVGSETDRAKYMRQKRIYEETRLKSEQCSPNVTRMLPECSQSIEIEKEKDIELEKEIEKDSKQQRQQKRFIIPSVEEVAEYCKERGNSIDPQRFWDYYESKGWFVGRNKMKDWKASVRTWERNEIDDPRVTPKKAQNNYPQQLSDEEYRQGCDDLDNMPY